MKLIKKFESATGETQCKNNYFHKETTTKTWHILRLLYDVSTETTVAVLNQYCKSYKYHQGYQVMNAMSWVSLVYLYKSSPDAY